jgi:CheY-like chemotaxis protein
MTTPGTPVYIFLVEDNAPDVVLIREALYAQNIDHRLQRCADGEEAIRVLSEAETPLPDLVILDLNLPRIGGFDILRWIRSRSSLNHVPVAILTSSQAAQDRELAASLGAAAFISKPPNLTEFLSVVGRTLAELLPRSRRDTTLRIGYRGLRKWYGTPRPRIRQSSGTRGAQTSVTVLWRPGVRSLRQSLRAYSLRLRAW